MEGTNDNVVSEVTSDDIQSLDDHAEHKSFRLTGGWKFSRGNKSQAKEITLKQALFEGALVDMFLYLVSLTVMDGGILSSITFFSIIAHQSASIYWALRSKGKVSESGKSFIRVGALLLVLIAIIGRILMFLVFELMNVDWY